MTTRATITARLAHAPYYRATCIPRPDPDVTDPTIQALMAAVKARASAVAPTVPYLTPAQVEQALAFMNQIDHPGQLADFVTYSPSFTFADKLALLNTLDPVERLRLVARTLGV